MISSIYRWLGRHPKACLIPVSLLALLTGAQLLARAYGETFIAEPFFIAAGLWLVLGTVTALGIARSWWLHNKIAPKLEHISAELAAIKSLLESITTPRWNGPTFLNPRIVVPQSSNVYGKPRAIGTKDFDEVMEHLNLERPEDTGPIGLVS